MTSAPPPLILERDGHVATVIINDPPRNRMTLEFMDELERVVDEFSVDKSVRAIRDHGGR